MQYYLMDAAAYTEHMIRPELTADQLRIASEAGEGQFDRVPVSVHNGVAVVSIEGPIQAKGNIWSYIFGGTSALGVQQAVREAMRDPAIEAVALNINSPGGQYSGTPEVAEYLYESRGDKPLIAVASPLAASGALWLGVQADRFYGQPSGQVGSIGAILPHVEQSKRMERLGYQVNMVRSPEGKADMNSMEPLSEEARHVAQANIDQIHREFVATVARGRNVSEQTVLDQFGRGRMMMAKEAARVGLLDGLKTITDVIGEYGTRRMSSETSRRRYEMRQRAS